MKCSTIQRISKNIYFFSVAFFCLLFVLERKVSRVPASSIQAVEYFLGYLTDS